MNNLTTTERVRLDRVYRKAKHEAGIARKYGDVHDYFNTVEWIPFEDELEQLGFNKAALRFRFLRFRVARLYKRLLTQSQNYSSRIAIAYRVQFEKSIQSWYRINRYIENIIHE